jgi:hypothetical protein
LDEDLSARDKKLSYSLHGLRQATLRCDAAYWHRPEYAFVAAAEGVSWVVALDEALGYDADDWDSRAYKDARNKSADGRTVIGMLFVRNHVHHAAELQDFMFLSAVVGNPEYGMRAGWVWTPLEELASLLDPKQVRGGRLYGKHLAGQNVLHTLLDANRWFSSLAPAVPPLPPDPAGVPRQEFALPERWPPVEGDRRI